MGASNPADEERARLRDKLDMRLRWVMSTEPGRATMWWILHDLGYLLSQTFSGEASHQNAFNAGQRQVAIDLMQELKRATPVEWREMLRERFEVNPDVPPR